MSEQKDYLGKNGFVWWHGVVEDVNDPLKIGRLRVRILGYHTDDKVLLPTEDLPLAMVLQPITSAAVSGVGTSPTGAVRGTWVMGFFRDGESAQDPVVMGSFAGIPEKEADKNKGFNDPLGKYPLRDLLFESDVNRLARGQLISETIVNTKRQDRVQGIRTAMGGAWSEPGSPFKAVYPMNNVTQTSSGHVIELDDTSSAPRIHIYHNSGSFLEMHPDGSVVDKVVGDDYEIDLRNKKIIIKGNATETVDGTKRQLVGGNFAVEVIGNLTTYVHGDHYVHTKGNFYHRIDGTCTVVSEGKAMQVAPRIDFNPPDFKAEDFPTMDQIKDEPPTTDPTTSTRGNDPEVNPTTKNMQNSQKFDTQVAALEQQKGNEKIKKSNATAKTASALSSSVSGSIPPEVTAAGTEVFKGTSLSLDDAKQLAGLGGQGKKKDCDSYCSQIASQVGGTQEAYEACLRECDNYNRSVDAPAKSGIGGDADCNLLGDLNVGGLLSPIGDLIEGVGEAIGDVIGGIQGAIEGGISGIGEAIFGTPEEQYCKDEIKYRANLEYASLTRQGRPPKDENGKKYSRSEYVKVFSDGEFGDTGMTRLEECIQWCKDNPEDFAEYIEEQKDKKNNVAVPSMPSVGDLGLTLDLNIPIPGLPSIPCLGIGIASIAGIATGIGAGIAVAKGIGGAGGAVAGLVTGAVAGVAVTGAVANLISPDVPTIEPPPPLPTDTISDAGTF